MRQTAGPHLVCAACHHSIPLASAARTGNGKGRLATCGKCDVVYTWRIGPEPGANERNPADLALLQ